MAKKNPVLEKVRKEAYDEGFRNGFKHGRDSAVRFFAERFERLEKTKGIGPKTMQRIINEIGREYFESSRQSTGNAAKSVRKKKTAANQKTD
jgi:predicted nucleic acid-binding OB-fold protein